MRCKIDRLLRYLCGRIWNTLWPWITLAAGPIFAISPFGRLLIHSAFYSGEQLARSLSEFLLLMIGIIWAALVLLEWLLRVYMLRRRANRLRAAPTE